MPSRASAAVFSDMSVRCPIRGLRCCEMGLLLWDPRRDNLSRRSPAEEWVRGCGMRAGEAGGFEAFVAARGSALWRTAWLLTGDAHLAEDLVQTALVKAWPKWDG